MNHNLSKGTAFNFTSMGVEKEIISEGEGAQVERGQTVTVHCTGKLANGDKFWSTHDNDEPFSFQCGVGQVIRAWDEGCLSMRVGEHAVLTASGDFAYGERGFPAWGIGPNATLIFEIEVLSAA